LAKDKVIAPLELNQNKSRVINKEQPWKPPILKLLIIAWLSIVKKRDDGSG